MSSPCLSCTFSAFNTIYSLRRTLKIHSEPISVKRSEPAGQFVGTFFNLNSQIRIINQKDGGAHLAQIAALNVSQHLAGGATILVRHSEYLCVHVCNHTLGNIILRVISRDVTSQPLNTFPKPAVIVPAVSSCRICIICHCSFFPSGRNPDI